MSRKLCIDCNIRPVNASTGTELCVPCFDYAGWENSHSDNSHDYITSGEEGIDWLDAEELETELSYMTQCPVCHPELDPRNATPKKGHTNGVAKTYSSHKACTHPSTPKHRELCRRERAKNS